MTLRSLRLVVPACVLVAPLFAGCGGAAVPAEAAKSAEDTSTPEGAAAAVDRAERTIDQLFGPSQSSTVAQQAGVAAPAGAPPSSPQPPPAASAAPVAPGEKPAVRPAGDGKPPAEPSPDERSGKKHEAPRAAGLDACSTACSALASMVRATDHLCSLAGQSDARCTSARTRVHDATARVRASCPSCGS